MKNLYIILIFFLSVCEAQTNKKTQMADSVLVLKVEEMQKEISYLKQSNGILLRNIEMQEKVNTLSSESIANQLSASSYNISVFGILFGIFAVLLGVYVTYIERKIVKLKEENTELLSQTKVIKDEVVKINDQIQKDLYGLFLKIKREETLHILNRLLKIPEDISNFSNELLSRELEKEDFYLLKDAYSKLKEKRKERIENEIDEDELPLLDTYLGYLESYKLLFFQHFLDFTTKDVELCEDMINFYEHAVGSAFENDITKSTQDFMSAIMEADLPTKAKEINAYIRALAVSDFRNFNTVYEIIFNSLRTRENRFTFFEIIDENSSESKIAKFKIGQLLSDKYSATTLSEREQKIIIKTSELLEILEKERKEDLEKKEKAKQAKAERKKQQEERKKAQEEKKKNGL